MCPRLQILSAIVIIRPCDGEGNQDSHDSTEDEFNLKSNFMSAFWLNTDLKFSSNHLLLGMVSIVEISFKLIEYTCSRSQMGHREAVHNKLTKLGRCDS